jgi:cytochrome c oxidase cbb3-type subunit III
MIPLVRFALRCALLAALASPLRGQTPAELDQGRRLFETHCSFCHGPRGEGGKGPTLAQPTLPRASDAASLLRIIRSGIPGTEMPSSRLEPHELTLVAAFVRALGSRPPEQVPGDAARGEQLYLARGACAQCHTVRGHGGAIGPDLTEIGRKRSAAYLRRALIEPTAEVPQSFSAFRSDVSMPENFLFVRATARDGRSAAGVRVNEDTFSIQLRDLSGRTHSFFKSDLAELHKDWGVTPMPSYAGVFTPAELDDLVAFLVSLRGGRKAIEPDKTTKTNTTTH